MALEENASAMEWKECQFAGDRPLARAGHTAVTVANGERMVVFGGTDVAERKYLDDLIVLDLVSGRWSRPRIQAGQGPPARAFHQCVPLTGSGDRCVLVMCGRSIANKRHNDAWILDTSSWVWFPVEIASSDAGPGSAAQPAPRDFSSATALPGGRALLFGGWDGQRWLSDLWMLEITPGSTTGTWHPLVVQGSQAPQARSGHCLIALEKGQSALLFGGGGASGALLNDLWALRGVGALVAGDASQLRWMRMNLSGPTPSPRSCASLVNISARWVGVFGGHSTEGWLSKHRVFLDDFVFLDREQGRWVRFEPPAAGRSLPPGRARAAPSRRCYHTLIDTVAGVVLFGGFDGKQSLDDAYIFSSSGGGPSSSSSSSSAVAHAAAGAPPADHPPPAATTTVSATVSTTPALNAGLTVLTSISQAFSRRRSEADMSKDRGGSDDSSSTPAAGAGPDGGPRAGGSGSLSQNSSAVFKGLKAREATKAWSVLRRSVGLPLDSSKPMEFVSSPRIPPAIRPEPLGPGSGGGPLPEPLRVGDLAALHRIYLSKVVQPSLWTIEPQEMAAFTLKEQNEALSLAHIPFGNLRVRDIQKIESFCR